MIVNDRSNLQARIESGGQILITEISPPKSGDPASLLDRVKLYEGKVHALGVSDNRNGASMSALAAATLVAREGVEPILHVVTRDRNRIALVSEFLGALALGVNNFLCTTGTHQTLGPASGAKNVFDLDSVQLLQAYANLSDDGAVVGEERFDGVGQFCLGAVATPFADPIEMQPMRVAKKTAAGANFLITQPVFDVERFETWWNEVTRAGIHERAAILAGIQPLADAESAAALARTSPCPMIPEAVLARLSSETGDTAQRAVGIALACETIQRLSGLEGLRGFEIWPDGDDDAALEVIEKSGLRCS